MTEHTHGMIKKSEAGKLFAAEFPQPKRKTPQRKLAKGSPAARKHMAKLRAMRGK